MKTKVIYFIAGLAVGLLAWFVGDRVAASQREQRYQAAMEEYEQEEFLAEKDSEPEYDHGALLKLELTNLSGTTRSLGEWAEGHETLFVNLWATWCGPCIQEMPSITNLHTQVGDDVAFFIISYEPVSTLQPFVEKYAWKLPVFTYGAEDRLPPPLSGEGVPRTFVIHNGVIVLDHLGAAPWDGEKAVSFMTKLLEGEPEG